MRVMVMVKATSSSEAGEMPTADVLEAMGKFNEDLARAGVLLAGEGLKPSRQGKRMEIEKGKRRVIDGPFAETNELVAGFWLWEVRDMDEAIEWARRCPAPMPERSQLEIRPVFEADDFGDAMTPELREQEERISRQIGKTSV